MSDTSAPRAERTRGSWITAADAIGLTVIAIAAVALYFLFPNNLSMLSSMIAIALLVISLDLVTGVTGVATLGQAALFGAGAYATGIAAANGVSEPVTLLLIGLVAGAAAGAVMGAIVLRTHGLPQLVLSIALVQLGHELVNKASSVTGGSDGLTGINVAPLLGLFPFDLWGRTAYWLGVVVLVLVVVFARRLIRSPLGMLCRGLRQDPVRIEALGLRAYPAAVRMFAISGAIAGLGGGLMAISTQVVGLDSISFTLSAEALVMLIVGGTGSIYGAIVGTFTFLWIEHVVSAANPFHWLAIVGALLIAVVLFAPRGILGTVQEYLRSRNAAKARRQGGDE